MHSEAFLDTKAIFLATKISTDKNELFKSGEVCPPFLKSGGATQKLLKLELASKQLSIIVSLKINVGDYNNKCKTAFIVDA